jgi:hypothetical protein
MNDGMDYDELVATPAVLEVKRRLAGRRTSERR